MVMVCTWFIYIWATYIHSLSWNKAIWGWFPLLTIIYGGRNEAVIIYPDNFKSTDLRWLKRCNRRVLLGNPQSSALFPFRLQILWCTYPSEKYDSQLGWLFPIYGKKNMFQTTNQMRFKQSHRVYIHSPQHVMASLVPSTITLEWHDNFPGNVCPRTIWKIWTA